MISSKTSIEVDHDMIDLKDAAILRQYRTEK